MEDYNIEIALGVPEFLASIEVVRDMLGANTTTCCASGTCS